MAAHAGMIVTRGGGLDAFGQAVETLCGARLEALLPRGEGAILGRCSLPEGSSLPCGVLFEARGDDVFVGRAVHAESDRELAGVRLLSRAVEGSEFGGTFPASKIRRKTWKAYRAERRAQVEVTFADGMSLHVRMERPSKAKSRLRFARAIAGWVSEHPQARLRVPHVLFENESAGILGFETLLGTSLFETLSTHRAGVALARAGKSVRDLHDLASTRLPIPLRTVDWNSAMADLSRLSAALHGIGVPIAAEFDCTLERLRATPAPLGTQTFLHGDLHEKQILLGGEVGILDFDLAGVGDPVSDLGNLFAQLRLRHLQGRAGLPVDEMIRAFRSGYGIRDEPSVAARVHAFEALTLLRLSGIYSLRPAWASLAERLLLLCTSMQTQRETPSPRSGGIRNVHS